MSNLHIHRQITSDSHLSEMVIRFPYALFMLEHFGLNIALQEKTIREICEEADIQEALFLVVANLYAGAENPKPIKYEQKDVLVVLRYLRHCHRFYKEDKYPQIKQYILQLKEQNPRPEIVMLERFFQVYFDEVNEHLDYENDRVFPYVADLLNKIEGKDQAIDITNYSVSEYKDHHDNIEEKLSDLKNLLVKYLPLGNDYALRRKLLFSLSELEFDLHIHSKIEDFVLIPLVEQMELMLKEQYGK